MFFCGIHHRYAVDTDLHALVIGVWLGVASGVLWVLASTVSDLPMLSMSPYLPVLLNASAGLSALGAAGYVVPSADLPAIRAILGL
jgi:hypothetical protein